MPEYTAFIGWGFREEELGKFESLTEAYEDVESYDPLPFFARIEDADGNVVRTMEVKGRERDRHYRIEWYGDIGKERARIVDARTY